MVSNINSTISSSSINKEELTQTDSDKKITIQAKKSISSKIKKIEPKKNEIVEVKKISIQHKKMPSFKKIELHDLPLTFQEELKEEFSDITEVILEMALKVSEISFTIFNGNSSKDIKDLNDALHVLPMVYYSIFSVFYSEKDKKPKDVLFISLKNSLHTLMDEIKKVLPNTSIENQKKYNTILNILNDFDESLIVDNKPAFLKINLSEVMRDKEVNSLTSPTLRITLLQSKINLSYKFYKYVYNSFIKNHPIFINKYSEIFEKWGEIDKNYKKIKKYLSEKRKKTINFQICDQIHKKILERIDIFYSLLDRYMADKEIKLNIHSESLFDYEKYGLRTYFENTVKSNRFVNQKILFLINKFMYYSLFNIQIEALKILVSYCVQNNLILTEKNYNKFNKYLDLFIKNLNKINISFNDDNKIFNIIQGLLERINKNYSLYIESEYNPNYIANIYYNLFSFRRDINKFFRNALKKLTHEVIQKKETIENNMNNSKKELREKNMLSQSLINIGKINDILKDFYFPMDEMISNFEEKFLRAVDDKILEEDNDITIDEQLIPEKLEQEPIFISLEEEKIESSQGKNDASVNSEKNIITKKRSEKFSTKLNNLTLELDDQKKSEYKSIHNVKFTQLIDEVIEQGFKFLKQTGSHMNFKNPKEPSLGIVTIPRHSVISPGVVKNVRNIIYKE